MEEKDREYIPLITSEFWKALKPYKEVTEADEFYTKLTNDIYNEFPLKDLVTFINITDSDIRKLQSIFMALVAYFEDKISEVNLYYTFLKQYRKKYKKAFPFESVQNDEMYNEYDLNFSDLRFIIWYVSNAISKIVYLDYNNKSLIKLAEVAWKYFEKHYDTAPVNKQLQDAFKVKTDGTFIQGILQCSLLINNSFLFHDDFYWQNIKSEEKLAKELDFDSLELMKASNNEQVKKEIFDASLKNSFKFKTRLLGLKSLDWLALHFGEGHEFYKLYQLGENYLETFKFYGEAEEGLTFEHLGSGNLMIVDFYAELFEVGSYYELNLIKYNNEWTLLNLPLQIEDEAKILEIENNFDRLKFHHFGEKDIALDKNTSETIMTKVKNAFYKLSKGKDLVFLSEKEARNYRLKMHNSLLDYMEALTEKSPYKDADLLKIEKDREALQTEDLVFQLKSELYKDAETNYVAYYNHNSGFDLVMNYASAFPCEENPYYNENRSIENTLTLFRNEKVSKSLAKYCFENYKDKLKLFKTYLGKDFETEFDFLMDFYKFDDASNMRKQLDKSVKK